VVGADGYFQRLNPRWREIVGFSADELLARPFLDFVHPDDRPAASFEKADFEIRFSCSDGTYRWLSFRTTTVMIAMDGASACPGRTHYCVVHDFTERKTAERRLLMQFAVTRALAGSN